MRPSSNSVRPPITRPDDFDRFWSDTLAALGQVPCDCELGTIVPAPEGATLAPVRFRSLGDAWIHGFLLTLEASSDDAHSTRRPLVITTHGYNSQSNPTAEARHVARGVSTCLDSTSEVLVCLGRPARWTPMDTCSRVSGRPKQASCAARCATTSERRRSPSFFTGRRPRV